MACSFPVSPQGPPLPGYGLPLPLCAPAAHCPRQRGDLANRVVKPEGSGLTEGGVAPVTADHMPQGMVP